MGAGFIYFFKRCLMISESRIIPLKRKSWSQDSANGEKSLGFIFQSLGRSAFVIISWAMVRRKRVTEPPPILGTSNLLPNLVESTWLLLNREANAGLQNSDPLLGHCWTCYRFWRNRLGCHQYTSIWWGGCGFTFLISESRIIPKLSVFESEEKFCLWRGYVEVDIGFHEGKSMFAEAYTEIGRASLHCR